MPDVGAILAGVSAVVSVIAVVIGVLLERHRRKRDRERTASLDASSVASAESRASLDFLLRERLGEVNVSSYFRDAGVRREVETAFEELESPRSLDPTTLPAPQERTISSKGRKWLLSTSGSSPATTHSSLDDALTAARASLSDAGAGKIEVHEPDGSVVIDRTRPRGARFMLYTDTSGQHRFMLRDSSGRPLLVSPGYTTRASALHGIARVKSNVDGEIVEIPPPVSDSRL